MADSLHVAYPLRIKRPFLPKASYRRPGYGRTHWNPDGDHVGVDLPIAVGTVVQALRPGKVTWRGRYGDLGYMFVMYDSALDATIGYCHLSHFGSPAPGDTLHTATAIARSGESGRASGPHLHMYGMSGLWTPARGWGSMPYIDVRPLIVEAYLHAA